MEEKIHIRDFPEFVRLEVSKGLISEVFDNFLDKIGEEFVDAEPYHGDQKASEFLHGKIGGKIVGTLGQGPLSGKEIMEKTGLSKNTFYHKIAEMKREGLVEGRYRLTGKGARFSDLKKLKSLAPEQRRRKGLSKEDVIAGLYLWPRYKGACLKEGIDPGATRYSVGYRNLFSLAQAVKMWKRGKRRIPKWALIAMAEAAGLINKVESKGAVISYSLPPGIKVEPYYGGEYKIPIRAGLKLDITAMQLFAKGTDASKYNHKNKKEFFERLHEIFGTFPSRGGRVPGAIREIIKKHYGAPISREHARIPSRITKKLNNLQDPEKMERELTLLEGALELGSNSRGYVEITSKSNDFLKDLSKISKSVGIGELHVRKRKNRPHYRCELSLRKLEISKEKVKDLERLYGKIEEFYPDFKIWDSLPLNRIREKIRNMDGDPERLQEICREELSHHLNLVLESISRNKPIYRKGIQSPYLREEMMNYFWDNKKIPNTRNVQDFLSARLADTPLIHRIF
jgi:predicted RNA-binding protein with RPS1 domain